MAEATTAITSRLAPGVMLAVAIDVPPDREVPEVSADCVTAIGYSSVRAFTPWMLGEGGVPPVDRVHQHPPFACQGVQPHPLHADGVQCHVQATGVWA